MIKDTIGWLIRTETNGHHRYWKVGAVEAAQAAAIAAATANADMAQAVTRLLSHYSPRYTPTQDAAIEVTWGNSPVTLAVKASESEPRIGAGGKVLGEITFDIIVPEDGVTHVEGCYRLNSGNWLVYYLTNYHRHGSSIDTPIINRKAVFSSGIAGVSGFFPADWLLNKKTIGEILAEAVGVDGWVEVTGPDSLALK